MSLFYSVLIWTLFVIRFLSKRFLKDYVINEYVYSFPNESNRSERVLEFHDSRLGKDNRISQRLACAVVY